MRQINIYFPFFAQVQEWFRTLNRHVAILWTPIICTFLLQLILMGNGLSWLQHLATCTMHMSASVLTRVKYFYIAREAVLGYIAP